MNSTFYLKYLSQVLPLTNSPSIFKQPLLRRETRGSLSKQVCLAYDFRFHKMFHVQHCLHALYTLLISVDSLSPLQTAIYGLNQQWE